MINDYVNHYLDKLKTQKFFGAVTIKMEAGQVVLVKVEQTLKEDDVRKIIKAQ